MIAADEVLRIAQLARLTLTPDQAESLGLELASILSHMSVLQGAGLQDAAEASESTTPQRPDLPGADGLTFPAAELSAASSEGFFTVPRLAALDGGP